jgi:hypothetical protein
MEFLEERARLQLGTSYTEMNTVLDQRTDLQPFDFDQASEHRAMGGGLHGVVREAAGSRVRKVKCRVNTRS